MYVWVTAFHNSPCEPCHLLRAPSMPWRYGEPVEGWWACTKAPTFSSWMAEQRPTIAIALCVAVKEGSHLYLWSVSWGSFSGFRGLGVGLVSRIFEHVMIWIFRRFTWIGTMKSIFHRFYGPIHFWSSTPSNIACFGNIWSIFKTNLSKGVIFIGSALKVWVFVLSKSRSFVRISTMLWSLLSNYLIQSKSKNVDWIFRFRVGILFDKHQVRFAHLTYVSCTISSPYRSSDLTMELKTRISQDILVLALSKESLSCARILISMLSNRFWIYAVIPTESVKSVPK